MYIYIYIYIEYINNNQKLYSNNKKNRLELKNILV